jgi:hydrogenase maturation protease
MLSEPSGFLVVGFGNELIGDDGAGPALARFVATHCGDDEVTVVIAHQLLPELAEQVSRCALLVLADADVSIPPGAFVAEWIEPAPGPPRSIHRLLPRELLGLARDAFGRAPRTLLVRIGLARAELGQTLSPTTTRAVRAAADRVREEIRLHHALRHDHRSMPRPGSTPA